jgi:hypothetical protein
VPRGSEHRLERALEALTRALDACGAPWTVIGGVAVIARGVRRMTTDVDAVVLGSAITQADALTALARHGLVPRIADAEAFAAAHLVMLLRHEATGVDIDLSFGWTEFESHAIAASTRARFGTVRAPIARPEDLVVLKAIAARPIDLQDATTLLLMHPDVDVAAISRRVGELATLAEAPELVAGFDTLLDAVRSARSSASVRSPPRESGAGKRRRRR